MQAEEFLQQSIETKNLLSALAREITEAKVPDFSSEPMTVKDVAALTGLTETAVRAGILNGWMPIGVAVKEGKLVTNPKVKNPAFVIYPRKVWEVTGHIWRGRDNP